MVTSRTWMIQTKSWYASFADGLARLGFWLVIANIVVSTVVGLIAIIAWPEVGAGPGGGWGVPGIALLLAAALGIPASLLGIVDVARGRWRQAGRLMAAPGPFLILVGFFFGTHLLDPCARGWIDPYSASCEAWGGGWNVHTRYHLLYHALIPTTGLVALYVALFRRWYPSGLSYTTEQRNGRLTSEDDK